MIQARFFFDGAEGWYLYAGAWYLVRVRIAVCDVGLGNLRSVERALLEATREVGGRRGATVEVTGEAHRVSSADMLVMPGQAAFGDCVRALSRGLGDAVRAHVAAERPYLGICLGLQVLFATSAEAPGCSGLGILEGSVVRLRGGTDPTTNTPLKIPHMGWNVAEPRAHGGRLGLLSGRQHYYFVHSYVVAPR
ncbi:MAG TPA: imidazole glycerol phosphate synthase subunit HisH, partial [Polyangiaceae bacterium]|nr:imidazole glycerol phosphate synthase subunit HisH [Polyangiaceae bacterium]